MIDSIVEICFSVPEMGRGRLLFVGEVKLMHSGLVNIMSGLYNFSSIFKKYYVIKKGRL